jgi:hypothetical protein
MPLILSILIGAILGVAGTETYHAVTKPQACGEYIETLTDGMFRSGWPVVGRQFAPQGEIVAFQDPATGDVMSYAFVWDAEAAAEAQKYDFKQVDECLTPAGEHTQILTRSFSPNLEAQESSPASK